MTIQILTGDCREVLRTLPENSVDSIVCDPPYELGFMGKAWDRSGVAFDPDTWAAALRVAKPGAFLLAFGGTRRFHRVACAIEDAGWELRDSIVRIHEGGDVTVQAEDCPWLLGWMFGTGFPKSHNGPWGGTALKPAYEPIIMARKPVAGTVAANFEQYGTGGLNIDDCRVEGEKPDTSHCKGGIPCRHRDYEPRQPRGRAGEASANARYTERGGTNFAATPGPRGGDADGRWPANILHDGSAAALSVFPESAGQSAAVGPEHGPKSSVNTYGDYGPRQLFAPRGDSGSAARFFWSPKASRSERDMGMEGFESKNVQGPRADDRCWDIPGSHSKPRANNHPTVKPVALMQYLCRLVTPQGGTVLDPFLGSGSTGIAASREGFEFIGIELSAEYAEIARRRIHADAPLLAQGVA